jgi:hypothetical protein
VSEHRPVGFPGSRVHIAWKAAAHNTLLVSVGAAAASRRLQTVLSSSSTSAQRREVIVEAAGEEGEVAHAGSRDRGLECLGRGVGCRGTSMMHRSRVRRDRSRDALGSRKCRRPSYSVFIPYPTDAVAPQPLLRSRRRAGLQALLRSRGPPLHYGSEGPQRHYSPERKSVDCREFRADGRTRTGDPFITRFHPYFTTSWLCAVACGRSFGSACRLISYLFRTAPAVQERRRNSKARRSALTRPAR